MIRIRFKDYDYLYANQHVSPDVVEDMFEFAGLEYYIDNPEFTSQGWLRFADYSWNPDWFVVLEQSTPEPVALPEVQTPMLDSVIEYLKNVEMPPNLQHIRIVLEDEVPARVIDFGTWKLDISSNRTTRRYANLFIKFTNTTEYNLDNYIYLNSRWFVEKNITDLIERFGNGRGEEKNAAIVIKNLASAVFNYRVEGAAVLSTWDERKAIHINGELYLLNQKTSNLTTTHYQLYHKMFRSFDVIEMLVAFAAAPFIESKYLPSDVAVVKHLFEYPEFSKDKVYFRTSDTRLLELDRAFVEENNLEYRREPILDIDLIDPYSDSYERNPSPLVVGFLNVNYSDYGRYATPRDMPEYMEVFNRFVNKYTSYDLELGVKYAGRYYHPEKAEALEREDKKLEEIGLTRSDYGYYKYNGYNIYIDDDAINDYDYSPSMDFYGNSEDVHFGVELEVDTPQDLDNPKHASLATGILGYDSYAMSDGSLDQGFEIATMPMTLDIHMENADNYKNAFTYLSTVGYKSHDTSTCGIHVHFDRTAFGTRSSTQNLKAAFLALILERNWSKVVKFSRRNFNRLEQWAKNKKLVADIYHGDTDVDVQNKFRDKYADGDKYNALNCNHRHTFELRIFRGTLNANTYLATLQFVSNLVNVAKYCKTLDEAQRITFEDIINYHTYPELTKYLEERNLNLEGGEQ